jgi:hypothetical protein
VIAENSKSESLSDLVLAQRPISGECEFNSFLFFSLLASLPFCDFFESDSASEWEDGRTFQEGKRKKDFRCTNIFEMLYSN